MNKVKSVKTFNIVAAIKDSQQLSKKMTIFGKKQGNLFNQEAPERIHNIHFDESRSYQFVGVKQLKAYYERARRLSKDKRRQTQNLAYSRNSAISKQSKHQNEFCSKQQIVEKVETKLEISNILNVSRISRLNFSAKIKDDELNTINRSSKIEYKPILNSSILKIKKNFDHYKQNWEKSSRQTQNIKGFPSIIRSAAQQRQEILKKQINQQNFKRQHINERMWTTVLRQKTQLKNIYDKEATRICKEDESFQINGKNKLELQKFWINEKGDKGYRFQMIKTDIHVY